MTLDPTVRGTYRPRRRRSGNPPPFQMIPRDLDILRAVARYRFLNTGHIRRLIEGSERNLANRLKGLFEHAYLDRPECQYDFYRPGGGSSLSVYALADKGARVLSHHDGLIIGNHARWSQKNKQAGRPFLEHTLAIADFAIAANADVAVRAGVDLTDGDDLLTCLPEATRALAKPYRLSVPVVFRSERKAIGVEPDYAFSLGFSDLGQRAYFLVEIDRGTMPIERSDLTQSSILRKFLAYSALWRAKLHTQAFGWRNFRVLVVTENENRATHMRDVLSRLNGGSGSPLFWFAHTQALYARNTLEHHWIDGSGSMQKLVPAGV